MEWRQLTYILKISVCNFEHRPLRRKSDSRKADQEVTALIQMKSDGVWGQAGNSRHVQVWIYLEDRANRI